MIQILTDLILIALGIWLLRSSLKPKKPTAIPPPVENREPRLIVSDPRVHVLKHALETSQSDARLNRQVALDAMAREARSVAALTAVLRTQGCNEKQIEEVLKSVEHREEGDLT